MNKLLTKDKKKGTILIKMYGYLTEQLLKIQFICQAESGVKIEILEEKKEKYFTWIKIKVLEGTCEGVIG